MKQLRTLLTLLTLIGCGPVFAQCLPNSVVDQYTYFVAVDATDNVSRETGLSSFTVYRSRNGGTATAYTTPTINETDTTNMPGVYEILIDEDMAIDSGDATQHIVLHITHAGMAPVTKEICVYRPDVSPGQQLTVTSGVGSANMVQVSGSATAADLLEAWMLLNGSVGNGAMAFAGISASGTAQSYSAGTPSLTLASATAFADDDLNGQTVLAWGSNEGDVLSACILDYVGSTDVATLSAAFATDLTGTISYVVYPTLTCEASGSSLTAQNVWEYATRTLTANTNLNDPTAAAIRAEIDSNSTQLAAILTDTGTTLPGLIGTPSEDLAADIAAVLSAVGALNDIDGTAVQTAVTAVLEMHTLLDTAFLNCEVNTANFAGSSTTLACILTDRDDMAVTQASGDLEGNEIVVMSGAQIRERRFIVDSTWDGANSELQLTLSRALPGTLADAVTAVIR